MFQFFDSKSVGPDVGRRFYQMASDVSTFG
jgi:hypothetical protein